MESPSQSPEATEAARALILKMSESQNGGDDRPKVITWDRFNQDCQALADINRRSSVTKVYGIPTGGCFVAQRICQEKDYFQQIEKPEEGCLVVDDLIDSGKTLERFNPRKYTRAVLYRKPHSPVQNVQCSCGTVNGWIKLPWEAEHSPTDAVVRLLEFIGEDPKRDGLKDTPSRVTRALTEMTVGYRQDPREILGRVFEESYDEIVILKDIPFTSLCEHHVAVFLGTVDIGYLPGKVVGLSKLARLVDCFSQRLQIQERLTREIGQAIETNLEAKGVAVIVRANHTCMSCRGVKKPGSTMVTSYMTGIFRDKPEARSEFLNLCQ